MSSMFEKLIDYCQRKNVLKRYSYLFLALFVSSICYNLLVYPSKIVAGGTSGLSILIEHAFNITPSYFILLFSVAILIIAMFVLGFEKTAGSIIASLAYPFFIDITSGITTIIAINNTDMLLISLYIGVISGWSSGMIYKMGFSNGGMSLIVQMLHEKCHIAAGKCSFLINMIIVVLGGLIFGINNLMYAIMVLFVSGIITDKVMLGISNNKMFYIITSKNDEVKNYLLNEMGKGVTEFKITSGYKGDNREALMTVVPTKEYFRITEGIKKIDTNVFFVVADSYQTSVNA